MKAHLTALAPLALAACAMATETPPPAELAERECFNVRDIRSFSSVDYDTVRIRVGVNDYYLVETFGTCTDLAWTDAVAIDVSPSNWICTDSAFGDVFTPRSRCAIQSISRTHAPSTTMGPIPYSAPDGE